MSRSAQKCRRSANFGSWRARALMVLRFMAFVLAFQVSGLAGAAIVVAERMSGDVSDCPLEKQGQECPPGCPQCHCAHAGGLAAPSSQLVLVSAAAACGRVGLERPESTLVLSPLRSNPYRPPRSV